MRKKSSAHGCTCPVCAFIKHDTLPDIVDMSPGDLERLADALDHILKHVASLDELDIDKLQYITNAFFWMGARTVICVQKQEASYVQGK